MVSVPTVGNYGNNLFWMLLSGLSDLLDFGDCHAGRTYQETFTMTNPSSSKVLRFEWLPSGPQLSFSPQVGHLHADCSKVVTVNFCSEEPIELNAQTIKCKLSSITFQQPVDQVPDWDDCYRTVKWMDVDKSSQQPTKRKVSFIESVIEMTVAQIRIMQILWCIFYWGYCIKKKKISLK